jgi:ATP synthase F1 complex assembly factor 2
MHYFDTDAVCYHEEFPEVLTDLQDKYWKPIIDWAQTAYDVKINYTTDIFAISQPQETKDKFRAIINNMNALELSAFEKAVMSSKSFLIGFALVHKGISVEHAAQAAQVEMNAQMDRWGEVEDSTYIMR